MSSWVEHAVERLQQSGFRRGGARRAVLEQLDRQRCAITAPELEQHLRSADGRAVSRASVYRILDELAELGLVTRVEVGQGVVRYEAHRSDGEHHHHLVCDSCGDVAPFEDDELERVMGRLAKRLDFQVDEHEIVLHGNCANCT